MDARNTKAPSMRVLTRPTLPPTQDPPASSSLSSAAASQGIVVVGFISLRPEDSSQIMNRVVDSNIFGSGNLDKILFAEKDDVKDWFRCRRISYYHEEDRGVLFLQFCSTRCPVIDGFEREVEAGFDSVVEDREFGDLQGLLFMFSVCHVIVYIQEGSRFDTQNLKKFRVLQAAKHALAPFVRSRTTLPLQSRPQLSSSRPSVSATSSNNSSPGRTAGILSRNSSAISLMSGLGSYTSLFPGQCTPVTLFVFIDDFLDVLNPSSSVEESTDASSLNQSSSLSGLGRPSLPVKGSGSVVVLARPINKSEGGFRKKLQSSLEAQIRFLIKKCRTLSGSETGHVGSRSSGISSPAPLFSLDASRAVVLLDRSTNQRGESLEFATGLVEDVLNGKATSDSLLLESHSQSANKEDILSIKEFIYRQSDILRGRGGLVANTNSGSVAGVGMVAVAAAAAAASAASGKTFTTPELPNLEMWLSSSQLILQGVLSAKRGCIDETEVSKRKPRQRNNVSPQADGIVSRVTEPLDIAVSWLESGKGLNTKFSTSWCQRALPAAKEVYLKDLPNCYPTSQHEAHLEKALHSFRSMVKGPAVEVFAKKLQGECTSIWKSGRQLCDAVSLTGKPCMHQRHEVDTGDLPLGAEVRPHSSGYVFLHACACGRSRQLRSDPFNFESANISSSCFPDCDKLFPTLQFPEVSKEGPIQPSSWSLIRVGGARYYEPSKGLLQSGFSATEKFLLKWTMFQEKQNSSNGLPGTAVQQGFIIRSNTAPKVEFNADLDVKKIAAAQLYLGDLQNGGENLKKPSENFKSDDKRISFGRGLPNFTLRKPFSEVVAGSASADSEFPPLQQKKHSSSASERGTKQIRARDRSVERVTVDHQGSQKSEDILTFPENFNGMDTNGSTIGDPFLRIGSNVVPVNMSGGEKIKRNTSLKHVIVYVGFEHECPHGHRFLLNPEHLNELGSSYSLLEECQILSSAETSDGHLADSSKLGKNGGHGRVHGNSNGMTAAAAKRVRNMDKSKEKVANGTLYVDGLRQFSGQGKQHNHTFVSVSTLPNVIKNPEEGPQSISVDDGGCAFSMLNRNLPIYMKCPHCRLSKNKKDPPKTKFSSTISQLQRIFLVTPSFPVVLATCPVIQFEASCLPTLVPDHEQKLQFSLGCRVILPPESFLTLRLPFVYGVQLENGSVHPLNPFEHQPEVTAWITKGTTLQVMSKGSSLDEGFHA